MLNKAVFIDQKYNKNGNIVKFYFKYKITVFYLKIFKNTIYLCDWKAEFSAVIPPDFTVKWSFRNHYAEFVLKNISHHYQCWKQLCSPISFLHVKTQAWPVQCDSWANESVLLINHWKRQILHGLNSVFRVSCCTEEDTNVFQWFIYWFILFAFLGGANAIKRALNN